MTLSLDSVTNISLSNPNNSATLKVRKYAKSIKWNWKSQRM